MQTYQYTNRQTERPPAHLLDDAEYLRAGGRRLEMLSEQIRRSGTGRIARRVRPGEAKSRCKVSGCHSVSSSLDLCGKHYQQWRNAGESRCVFCGAAWCQHRTPEVFQEVACQSQSYR